MGRCAQGELPERKGVRLRGYDYSAEGAYFITICTKDKRNLLSRIVNSADVGGAVLCAPLSCVPAVELTDIGKAVQAYLERMNAAIKSATLEKYVIMPNHVHLLIVLNDEVHDSKVYNCGAQRTAPPTKPPAPFTKASPTKANTKAVIPRIVHGMKAMTTKQLGYSIWQRSYHDHIIRNEADYLRIWQYIDENQARWVEDKYYTN